MSVHPAPLRGFTHTVDDFRPFDEDGFRMWRNRRRIGFNAGEWIDTRAEDRDRAQGLKRPLGFSPLMGEVIAFPGSEPEIGQVAAHRDDEPVTSPADERTAPEAM